MCTHMDAQLRCECTRFEVNLLIMCCSCPRVCICCACALGILGLGASTRVAIYHLACASLVEAYNYVFHMRTNKHIYIHVQVYYVNVYISIQKYASARPSHCVHSLNQVAPQEHCVELELQSAHTRRTTTHACSQLTRSSCRHISRAWPASLAQAISDVLSEFYTYVHTYMYHTHIVTH